MTTMDYYSMLGMMVFFFSSLSCMVIFSTWYCFRRKIQGTEAILAGFLFLTAGVTLVVIGRPILDRRIIQAGGNLLEAIGSSMLLIGFTRIFNTPTPRVKGIHFIVLLAIANAASLAAYLLMSWLWFSNLVEALSNAVPAILIAILVFDKRNSIERSARIISGIVFSAIALFFAAVTLFSLTEYLGIPLGSFPTALLDLPNPIVWGGCLTCLALVVSYIVSGVVGAKLNESLADAQNTRIALERANRELNAFQKQILLIFNEAFGYMTDEMAEHGRRIAIGTKATLIKLGYAEEYADFVAEAVLLHDIGKVRLPEAINRKTGLFSEEERQIMRAHPRLGHEILSKSDIPFFKLAAAIAYEHHERWDGNGYPLGKSGEEICLEARVVAVVDAFDALMSPRCYNEVWPRERAREYILEHAGSMYDPAIAVAAMQALEGESFGSDSIPAFA